MAFSFYKNKGRKKVKNRLSNAVRIFRIFDYVLRINQRIRDFSNYN